MKLITLHCITVVNDIEDPYDGLLDVLTNHVYKKSTIYIEKFVNGLGLLCVIKTIF